MIHLFCGRMSKAHGALSVHSSNEMLRKFESYCQCMVGQLKM